MSFIMVPSKSKPLGPKHRLTLDSSGACVHCDCTGFKHKRWCSHQREHNEGRGYSQNPNVKEIVETAVAPMLASAMPEGRTIDDYNGREWVLEEKYDGHRMLVTVKHYPNTLNLFNGDITGASVTATSRGAKARTLPPHIVKAASALADGTYDGELRVPGGTSTDVTDRLKQHLLEYVIFDIVRIGDDESVQTHAWKFRRQLLEVAASKLEHGPVMLSHYAPVSKQALQDIWDRGGEGAIVKHIEERYTPGLRSKRWVKFKKLAAAELTIMGFEAGRLGPHSTVLLLDDHGVSISVKSLNDDWRAAFARGADRFIGMRMTISYQEKTRDGKYRHPMADHIIGVDL